MHSVLSSRESRRLTEACSSTVGAMATGRGESAGGSPLGLSWLPWAEQTASCCCGLPKGFEGPQWPRERGPRRNRDVKILC